MQQQNYFIVVLAHLHGRLRRIQVPHQFEYITSSGFSRGLTVLGFVSSYARMAWKVANYNALRQEADALRLRYQNLQRVVNQTNQQLATLQLFANEISVAYGLKRRLDGPSDIVSEGQLMPSFSESVRDYNFLRGVAGLNRNYMRRFHINVQPEYMARGRSPDGCFRPTH